MVGGRQQDRGRAGLHCVKGALVPEEAQGGQDQAHQELWSLASEPWRATEGLT